MTTDQRISMPQFYQATSASIQVEDSHWRHLWSLDSSAHYLNHGSFGACPTAILEHQRSLQYQLEQHPLRFFVNELEPLLDQSRAELANFVGANPDDLVFVPNATAGVNTVLRSLKFEPGDELLTTNHEYNASRNALNFVAERARARVIVADIPFPIESPQAILDALLAQLSPHTRLVLLDHVTSQTGVIFPIETIARSLAERGIDLLIDGAHAPGMISLNLAELGVPYYTGNCHKWLCAPKGAGFLYVQRDRQSLIRPLSISHGANSPRRDRSQFLLEFDWTGTDDPSAYLCVGQVIRFLGSLLPGGWTELMTRNHELAVTGRTILCEALDIPPPCPASMIGSMAALPLPDGSCEALHDALSDRFHIEVPIFPWPTSPKRMCRISAQLYNMPHEYEELAAALIPLVQEVP